MYRGFDWINKEQSATDITKVSKNTCNEGVFNKSVYLMNNATDNEKTMFSSPVFRNAFYSVSLVNTHFIW